MTNFIATASVRDHDLSAEIMALVPKIIECENFLRSLEYHSYVKLVNGKVVAYALLVIEDLIASAPNFYGAELDEIAEIVREFHPQARFVNVHCNKLPSLSPKWFITGANFKSRILTVTKNYLLSETEIKNVKLCQTEMGPVLVSVLDSGMGMSLRDEPCTVEIQKAIDAVAGVAAAQNIPFMVQAMSPIWQNAFLTNPNYVFCNSTVTTDLFQ